MIAVWHSSSVAVPLTLSLSLGTVNTPLATRLDVSCGCCLLHLSRMSQAMLLRLWRPSGWRGSGSLLRFTSTAANAQKAAEPVLEEARPASEIPGPRLSFPALMNLNRLKNDPDWNQVHKLWMSLIARYGPIVLVKIPAFPPVIALSSPKDCKELNRMTMNQPHRPQLGSLKKIRDDWTDDYFEKRGGIVLENGDEWWRVRSRVQTPLLKPMVVGEYVQEMDDVSLTFVDRIKELQDKHGEMPENFQEELYKWALESVGVVALDKRFGCLGAPAESSEAQRGEELINVVNTIFDDLAILEMRFPVWRLFKTPTYRRLRDNHAKLLRVVEEQVAQTVASLDQKGVSAGVGGRQTSVLQSLLATPGLTHKDILTFIMDLVFAGIDTTSHTMAFCLYLLARNPEAQKKLQKEVDEVTAGHQGPLTSKHLARLSYTKAVIKESLRVFPLVLGFGRILTQDVVMQGYRIPAGHFVFALNMLMGWDASVFHRVDEFLPERWLRDRPMGDIHPYASIPFGAGPRMCVGRRVAEQEMFTLLTRVAQRFTVEYHHEDIELRVGLVSYPSRPLKFSFVSR